MSQIVLFGSTTPAGAAFLQLPSAIPILRAGRTPGAFSPATDFIHLDLTESVDKIIPILSAKRLLLVSFAPIWHLADFISRLYAYDPSHMRFWDGIIACSSSSVATKRFSSNQYDRHLACSLRDSESRLKQICTSISIPLRVVCPTLIYGSCNGYSDKNITKLHSILHRLPIIPIPSETGHRQPIHCSQLAAVVMSLVQSILTQVDTPALVQQIFLGGDDVLTYREMISRIRCIPSLSSPDKNTYRTVPCLFLSLPSRFFYFLMSPVLLVSPKAYEAILRIGADLSGFTRSHEVLNTDPQSFPVLPLAT